VRFRAEHSFPAPAVAVAHALVDPAVALKIELPDLGPAELLGTERDDRGGRLELCYVYVGQLDPVARRLLGARRLELVQVVTMDFGTLRGAFTMTARGAGDKLQARATVALADGAGGHSKRTIDGEFTVRVPLVGGAAERRILPGVVRRLDVEADALAAHLRGAS